MVRRHLLIGVLFAVLFGLGWWAGRGGAAGDLYAHLDLFVEVLHKIEDHYVDPVEPSRLVEGALRGVLHDLDPYSQFLDRKSYAQLQDLTHGRFSGIGVVVGLRNNYPTVVSPIEGSPAWRAGLTSGDQIVRIDGKASAGLSIEEAAALLRGPENTQVTVTVRREGSEEERDFVLDRREIVTRSVPYAFALDGGVGYMRLANFSEKSGTEVRAALDRLRDAGVRSLILDVRMNPGGLLDQAVDVAEQFLPEGSLLVYTRGRAAGQNNRYYAAQSRPETGWPMVVLIDPGSASASEIVAGALQDRDRALVIGRTSFGKGSVQSVFPLRGRDAALKLTTALYYTPSGRSIHRAVRDSSVGESDEDEEAPDESPHVPAVPDTAGRPIFLTAGGRPVYGGGGITPDVVIAEDSLPPLATRIEQRGLAFRFANRWVNRHADGKQRLPEPGPAMWAEYLEFLRAEKLTFDDSDVKAEREWLDRGLRRELARRVGGDSTAVRVVLSGDPVFRRAIEVLGRSQKPADVFSAAAGTARPAPGDPSRSSRDRARPAREPEGGGARTRSSSP